MRVIKKSQLRAAVRRALNEQIDMRTKEGRELKAAVQALLDKREELTAFQESIASIRAKEKELSSEFKRMEKSVFDALERSGIDSLTVADVAIMILEVPKNKRVQLGYKQHYEIALQKVHETNEALARELQALAEVELEEKRAERVRVMTIKDAPIKEQMLRKVGSWIKNAFAKLFSVLSRESKRIAKAAQDMEKIRREISRA